MKTLTYTAKCSKKTHHNLVSFLEQQRQLWNAALEQRITAYKRRGESLSAYDQSKELTELRKDNEFSQYRAQCQRSILFRLHKAFQNFFARVRKGGNPGFPRFKGKNRTVKSFEFPSPSIKRVNKRWVLNVKGVGKFRFKIDERFDGTTQLARIVVTPRRVKVQVLVETPECEYEDQRESIGIDVGITQQVTLSNGDQFPKRVRNTTRLKKLQRKLSQAQKGSNGRRKKRLAYSKEYQRIADSERGYIHWLTTELVKHYSSKFYIEDLRILNMVKNHKLARSILEQQWGLFGTLLGYKAENAGGWVRKRDPRNTSQRCSGCGAMPEKKLTLSDRMYVCMACGLVEDRDVNAAKNVLQGSDDALPGGRSIPATFGEGRAQSSSELAENAEQYT